MTLDDIIDTSVDDDRDVPMPQRPQEQSYEMQQYNPFAPRNTMQTFDERVFDRVVTIRKPEHTQSGEMWFTDGKFAEIVSLCGWNKQEQTRFMKRFRRIQMLSTGELNAKIVDSRQDRLMLDVASQKGRKDVVEGGNTNEREMWITSNQNVIQTLKQSAPQKPQGFFATIADGLSRRR